MKKVLISGYYGFGNVGDEAILQSMIQELNRMSTDIEITVLSQNPKETTEQFKVNAVNRSSFFTLINTIKSTDVLMSGGGSLLQESTSKMSIYYYLFIYLVAMICKKKIVVFSQGIGPVHRKSSKWLIKKVFNQVTSISVRDDKSKMDLMAYGVKPESITVTADPVIGFDKFGKEEGRNIFKKDHSFDPTLPTIGFALKSSKTNCVEDDFVKVIEGLKQKPCNIVLIPFHHKEDQELMKKIQEISNHHLIVITERYHVNKMFSMIEALDVLVGVRLHALIFAAVSGTPVVGISYDPKIDAFLTAIHEKSICDVNNMDIVAVIAAIEDKIKNHDRIQKQLSQDLSGYKERLSHHYMTINDLLDLR